MKQVEHRESSFAKLCDEVHVMVSCQSQEGGFASTAIVLPCGECSNISHRYLLKGRTAACRNSIQTERCIILVTERIV